VSVTDPACVVGEVRVRHSIASRAGRVVPAADSAVIILLPGIGHTIATQAGVVGPVAHPACVIHKARVGHPIASAAGFVVATADSTAIVYEAGVREPIAAGAVQVVSVADSAVIIGLVGECHAVASTEGVVAVADSAGVDGFALVHQGHRCVFGEIGCLIPRVDSKVHEGVVSDGVIVSDVLDHRPHIGRPRLGDEIAGLNFHSVLEKGTCV